jgi:hypothetical protein
MMTYVGYIETDSDKDTQQFKDGKNLKTVYFNDEFINMQGRVYIKR